MSNRFRLIQQAVGTGPLIRTLIVLLGSILMPVGEWFFFRHLYGAALVIVVTTVGWVLRREILWLGGRYSNTSFTILSIYGVGLFLLRKWDTGMHAQLLWITLATVVSFNLNFWSLSQAAPGLSERAADASRATRDSRSIDPESQL